MLADPTQVVEFHHSSIRSKNHFPIHAADQGQILCTRFDSTPVEVFPGFKLPESRMRSNAALKT